MKWLLLCKMVYKPMCTGKLCVFASVCAPVEVCLFMCADQREWSPWCRLKRLLFHLNCIIKNRQRGERDSPSTPHKVWVPCQAKCHALLRLRHAKRTFYTPCPLSLSFSQITFMAICLYDISHSLLFYFSGLPLLSIDRYFNCSLQIPLSFFFLPIKFLQKGVGA